MAWFLSRNFTTVQLEFAVDPTMANNIDAALSLLCCTEANTSQLARLRFHVFQLDCESSLVPSGRWRVSDLLCYAFIFSQRQPCDCWLQSLVSSNWDDLIFLVPVHSGQTCWPLRKWIECRWLDTDSYSLPSGMMALGAIGWHRDTFNSPISPLHLSSEEENCPISPPFNKRKRWRKPWVLLDFLLIQSFFRLLCA